MEYIRAYFGMGSCFKEENILTSVESKVKDSLRRKAFPCGFGAKKEQRESNPAPNIPFLVVPR